jgi:hypothetical protein
MMRAGLGKLLLTPTAIATGVLVAMGLVFAVGGLRLGLWTFDGPGPGLLPLGAATLLLVVLVPVVLTQPREAESFRKEPLIAIGMCCLFAFLAPRIGVVIPCVLLVTLWVRFLHEQSWLRAGLVGAGLTAAGIGLFHVLLKVPMPLIAGLT